MDEDSEEEADVALVPSGGRPRSEGIDQARDPSVSVCSGATPAPALPDTNNSCRNYSRQLWRHVQKARMAPSPTEDILRLVHVVASHVW